MVQCNFLTDILDLVYLRYAKKVQRVHLSTDEPAASRMLETFGEVGGDVSEYFASRSHTVEASQYYECIWLNFSDNYDI